jgi:hypothetical protein
LASSGSSFHVSMNGPPTGDFHSIYNAPMLGAHNPLNGTAYRRPLAGAFVEETIEKRNASA